MLPFGAFARVFPLKRVTLAARVAADLFFGNIRLPRLLVLCVCYGVYVRCVFVVVDVFVLYIYAP